MDTRAVATILGTLAATSGTVAFIPQITKIWRTGGKDVSDHMLWLYLAGVTLWLCYGVIIGATALSLANAVSIMFVGICLVLKFAKARQISVRTQCKRLRIAVDMDETMADSLKEHIRRYNATFDETITVAELHGEHIEGFVPANRTDTVRRPLRDESFFDGLEVIADAQDVLRELALEHDVF